MGTSVHREKRVPAWCYRFCVWKEKQRIVCPGWYRCCLQVQKKTKGGIFLFVLIVEIRRIKLFTLKITLNISKVGVPYTLIVQLWNNIAFHAIIWHILGVERFSCNHLSHICLWYDILKNKEDWCYTFSTTFRGTLNGQNFGLDFYLQKDNDLHGIKWPKHTSKSILQRPGSIMSFFAERKSDLKDPYTFIRNNTQAFKFVLSPKCGQNTTDFTVVFFTEVLHLWKLLQCGFGR